MAITSVSQVTSSLNLASNIRWIALLPIKQLFPEMPTKNISFSLQSFEIPELVVATSEVSYQGAAFEIPQYVKSGSKNITFEYLCSSDFAQYKALYAWLSKCVQEQGTGAGSSDSMASYSLPIKVILLSEFKKPILSFYYENCFLKYMGPLKLDYKDTEGSVITHSFTLSYAFMKVIDPVLDPVGAASN